MRASIRDRLRKSRPTAAEAVVAPPPPSTTLDRDVAMLCSDPIMSDRVFKVVTIGAPGIGKTSMLRVASGQDFSTYTKSTIGYDFIRVRQSNNVTLHAYDTAGLERHNVHMAPFYCRGAHAVLLCYDVTDRRTFDALLQRYMPPVIEEVPRAMLVLVGTKMDLRREMTGSSNGVARDVALAEVERRSIPLFRETSAAEHPEVICQMFADIASLLYNRHVPVSLKGIPPFKEEPIAVPPSTPIDLSSEPSPPTETTALRVADAKTSSGGGGGGCC
jgi:small GTP-binding protein